MLQIEVPSSERYDEANNEFITIEAQTLQLEHSLVSLSKWESKWRKSFMEKFKKSSHEEVVDYIKCMTLTENVNPNVYDGLTQQNIDDIVAYINDPMTATTIRERASSRGGREIVTAELIYFWMLDNNIPFECRYWHLNQLLTLVRVCNAKRHPPKAPGKREMAAERAALNAARLKQFNTTG